jgi:hypothetical protein
MTAHGIFLRGYGTSRTLFASWEEIARAAEMPGEMPAKHVARKLDWLTSK